MSDYPTIIKAAFSPEKAQRILQREQQQRGIVKITEPRQRRTVLPAVPTQQPPAIVVIAPDKTQPCTYGSTLSRAAALLLTVWMGV